MRMHKSYKKAQVCILHYLDGDKEKSKGQGSFHFVYASIRGKCNVPDVVNVNEAMAAYLTMFSSRDHTHTQTHT